MPSKAERRQKWNNVGENKVVLHMFHRDLTRPCGSPFGVKLETYLRMAGIEYETDFEEPMGTKGKCPWITFNGEEIMDSQFCIEHLNEKLDKDLDKGLDAKQKAESRAMRIMLEDHLYWCMNKIGVEQNLKFAKSVAPPCTVDAIGPRFLSPLIWKFIGRVTDKQTRAQGIGRHSREEVEKLGIDDLRALSDYMGNNQFLMGNEPTQVDCSAFAFLCFVYAGDPEDDSKIQKAAMEEFGNLKEYFERMKAKYYPDWDNCIYHQEEKE